MAAEHVWVSRGSQSFAVAANWSSGVVPAGLGDSVVYRGFASNVPCTLDMDRTADGPFYRIVTEPDYRGAVGTEADPLHARLQSSTDRLSRVIHRGQDIMYFKGATGAQADFVCGSENLDLAADITGEFRNIVCARGTLSVRASVISGIVVVIGPYTDLAWRSAATPLALMLGEAGFADNYVPWPAAAPIIGSGTFWFLRTPVDATRVILQGHLRIEPDTGPGVTGADILCDGLFDASHSVYRVQFDKLIVGVNGNILGTPYSPEWASPLATDIDLRQEYP